MTDHRTASVIQGKMLSMLIHAAEQPYGLAMMVSDVPAFQRHFYKARLKLNLPDISLRVLPPATREDHTGLREVWIVRTGESGENEAQVGVDVDTALSKSDPTIAKEFP